MPLTKLGLAIPLIGGLLATGNIGPQAPNLGKAVAAGTFLYLTNVKAVSIDKGLAGSGTGVIPLLVPFSLLFISLTTGFAAGKILGPVAPQLILGLTLGYSEGLQLGTISTIHGSVGLGSGVTKIVPSGSAVTYMKQGFADENFSGDGAKKMAFAIGTALDLIFSAYTTITPIQGAPGQIPATGAGYGKIL